MRRIEWGNSIFIIGYHVALLISLPFYFMHHSPSWKIYLSAFLLLYISGLSVTAGYHRLYSHRTYKTNKFVEFFYLLFATMATQGSALKWCCDHRRHHSFVDTDRDPYCVKKSFMHAHVLWLFRRTEPFDSKIISDLQRNKLLVFQHKYYVPLMVFTNTCSFLFVGFLFKDYLGAFVIAWWLRLFVLHHFTWFINSLAHYWGSQSFSQEHTAVDNYITSLLTFGEGYHNYHHTFANDYRNGIKWYHFDPTKWLIWLLSKCRLTKDLKRVSQLRIKERMITEQKAELKDHIKEYWFINKRNVEEKIEKISDNLTTKLSEMYKLLQQYNLYKTDRSNRTKVIKLRIKSLRKSFKQEWNDWQRFSKSLSNLKPISI